MDYGLIGLSYIHLGTTTDRRNDKDVTFEKYD